VIKTYIIVALVSYLLGSIPFGYILVKLFLKQDIRATGSGNIGATNVARSGAKGLAIATLVLDALKGSAAVLIVGFGELINWAYTNVPYGLEHPWTNPPDSAHIKVALAAMFAILGHMFPVWLKFRGGKGVATAVGSLGIISPYALGLALVAFLIVVASTRYVSLGSIVASGLFPILAWAFERGTYPSMVFIIVGICGLLIILKHHENIRRLLAGTESKFGGKKSVPAPEAMEKQA
jgi:acyl phosphate:glycerol-3-phosphate acyltransferase